MRKPVLPYINNKVGDQPVHLRCLISGFVVHYLDSIIPILAKSEISRLQLVSVAEQTGLSLTWWQTLKTDFLVRGSFIVEIKTMISKTENNY